MVCLHFFGATICGVKVEYVVIVEATKKDNMITIIYTRVRRRPQKRVFYNVIVRVPLIW